MGDAVGIQEYLRSHIDPGLLCLKASDGLEFHKSKRVSFYCYYYYVDGGLRAQVYFVRRIH